MSVAGWKEKMNSYWKEREELSSKAKKHIEEMEEKYHDKICELITETKIYTTEDTKVDDNKTEKFDTIISVEELDSVSAVEKYHEDGNMALLNFASYKNPGGQFLSGSKAQEECICHESVLFNVIRKFEDFYHWNANHQNKGLYDNRALYSPNIIFTSDNENEMLCDVITCASPNRIMLIRYKVFTEEENNIALKSRINFILDIARKESVETLILGAFGCGVFRQDPHVVASMFKEALTSTHEGCFKKVVFAIPSGKNLEVFKKVFTKEEITNET